MYSNFSRAYALFYAAMIAVNVAMVIWMVASGGYPSSGMFLALEVLISVMLVIEVPLKDCCAAGASSVSSSRMDRQRMAAMRSARLSYGSQSVGKADAEECAAMLECLLPRTCGSVRTGSATDAALLLYGRVPLPVG